MTNPEKFPHRNALCISIFAENIKKEQTLHLRTFVCGHCDLFSSFSLFHHIPIIHNLTEKFYCLSCSVVFGCAELLESHEKQIQLQASPSAISPRAVSDHNLQPCCVQNSINDTFKIFRLNLEPENVEPLQFLTLNEESIISILRQSLLFYKSNTVGITIRFKLCRPFEEERVTINFHLPMEGVAHELIQDDFTNMIDALISLIYVYWSDGSGRDIENPKTSNIRIAGPFQGTESSFIEIPAELKNVYRSLLKKER